MAEATQRPSSGHPEATVTSLVCHPVKSCRGVPLSEALVTPAGMAFDRNWIVADGNGKFITQREVARLALVEVALTPASLLTGADPASHPDAVLVLRAPGMAELQVRKAVGFHSAMTGSLPACLPASQQ